MSIYFLDASAVVKRYVTEPGSDWVTQLTANTAGNSLIVARVTWVEVLSALSRRQREGNVRPHTVDAAIQAFQHDFEWQYQIVELDSTVIRLAGQLVQRQPLRAYDAMQLAAGLQVQLDLQAYNGPSLTFVTADQRLERAAHYEGLHTDNPLNYP